MIARVAVALLLACCVAAAAGADSTVALGDPGATTAPLAVCGPGSTLGASGLEASASMIDSRTAPYDARLRVKIVNPTKAPISLVDVVVPVVYDFTARGAVPPEGFRLLCVGGRVTGPGGTSDSETDQSELCGSVHMAVSPPHGFLVTFVGNLTLCPGCTLRGADESGGISTKDTLVVLQQRQFHSLASGPTPKAGELRCGGAADREAVSGPAMHAAEVGQADAGIIDPACAAWAGGRAPACPPLADLRATAVVTPIDGSYQGSIIPNQQLRLTIGLTNAGAVPIPLAGVRVPVRFNRSLIISEFDYGVPRAQAVPGGPSEYIISCFPGAHMVGPGAPPMASDDECAQIDASIVLGARTADDGEALPAADEALPDGGILVTFLGPASLCPGCSIAGGGPDGALFMIRHLEWVALGDQTGAGLATAGTPTCDPAAPPPRRCNPAEIE